MLPSTVPPAPPAPDESEESDAPEGAAPSGDLIICLHRLPTGQWSVYPQGAEDEEQTVPNQEEALKAAIKLDRAKPLEANPHADFSAGFQSQNMKAY